MLFILAATVSEHDRVLEAAIRIATPLMLARWRHPL